MNTEKGLVYALLLLFLLQVSTCLDILDQNNTIKDGNLLLSSGKTFALGFFSSGNSSNRYVGIWFHQISELTVVWVANRERPIRGTSGALSIDSDGNLVLHETNGSFPVWSTNVSSALSNDSTTARLTDSGNLVLVQDFSQRLIWQSFDYPTDTMLPFMKLGLNRKTGLDRFLTSWKSLEDPTPGNCSYRMDPTGYPQLFLYKDGVPYWRAGSWIGDRWSGVPEMINPHIFNVSFVDDPDEVSIMYGAVNTSIITRMSINPSGSIQRSTWHDQDQRWIEYWYAPKDQCDYYGNCGPNSNCNPYIAGQFECTCPPGFEPKSPGDWYLRDGSAGCVRRGGVSVCRSGEGFVKVALVKVPDTSKARANMSLSLKECEKECLGDCSCTAYASANEGLGGLGCLTWHGDLVDTRTFADIGQDLYVRVDAVELARYRKTSSLSRKATVAIVLVSVVTALLLAGSFSYRFMIKKRKDRRSHNPLMSDIMNPTHLDGSRSVKDRDDGPRGNRDVPLFDLSTLASATNNFSILSKLGQGGFGSVYKGIMGNGTEIAVKRLSKHSGQGVQEFKNEVRLIAKLQHRNLVRLLGCCVEEDEKMLIYEYLPNKSLDAFLFDTTQRSMLDWRKRFDIASGVARGLLYLHQDSRLRIIHRDLKASNVLLDDAMNPKISDFGMARICGADQIQGNTNRVVGTYGYMSPEYAMGGIFSIKSDVYSFGVLLLEIISGKRNTACHPENPSYNLVGHVWELWNEGNCEDVIDESMGDSCAKEEALRCIQIGLLCVQELAEDRPNMSAVVFMLANKDVVLASPKRPAYVVKSRYHGGNPSARDGTASANDVTISMVEGR
ncbi:G-type lectin S-receptor-like serine/threonine-protein kinase RKS1 [Rhodamnia argentea]|uniref:Receptor-like serine/threonine-protein kinase n=1 Tax=Rhodamnia argentea TaxID=178133 RepID=A0ABM3HW07_9MYRT|nr:G-type lectin S-receptor-like serine/threonine-protein kinase RKS1 [Rhodamnia argentea]